jgi:tetratricopeptide (TPR) repeat protein
MAKANGLLIASVVTILFLFELLSAQDKRIIAILPFTNTSTTEADWVGRGIEEILYDKMNNLENVVVFEKETITRVLNDNDIRTQKDVTVRKAFSIGKETGVDVLLTGEYQVNKNLLNIQFRLISTYTGGDIYQKSVNEPIEKIFSLHQQAILEMMQAMNLMIEDSDRIMLARSSTESIDAFKSYCQAYAAFQQGARMEVVANYFLQAIATDPDFWEAQYNLGVIYYNYDQYDRAIEQFNKVIQKNPNFFKPFYGLGVISYIQRKNKEAISSFEKVLTLKPDHDRSLYFLGRIYLRIDSTVKALEYFDESAKINPNYAPTQFQIGVANVQRGWYKSAINAYKKSLKLFPKNAKAHNALGECYYILQRFDDAIYHYSKAVELEENYSTAYFNLGNAVYKKGALQDIVDAYLEILDTRYSSLNEENTDTKIADDLKELKNKTVAEPNEVYLDMIKAYRTALTFENKFFEAAFNLALTYENLAQSDSAEFYYKKAIEINPDLVRAYMRLGRLYENQKRYADALTAFKNVVKLEPSYFAGVPYLGEEYRNINIIEDVLEEYQTKNDTKPNNPETLIVLARIFNSLGRLGQAEQYYQQIVQIDPLNQEANEELRNLKNQMKKL